MSPYSGPHGTWWKIATLLLPFSVAAIFAFATLKADVKNLQTDVGTKASQAVQEANQEAILRELNQIEQAIAEIKSQHDRIFARLR